jgi:hypothetical protein
MKYLLYILVLSTTIVSCVNSSKNERKITSKQNKKSSSIILEANFKGTFIDLSNESHNTYYLADVSLINHTDSICKFIVYTCQTAENYLIDSKGYTIFGHRCAGNFPGPVTLKPNQVFSVPIIFCRNKETDTSDLQIRFGFIALTPKYLFSQDKLESEILHSWRESQTNVIWSEPITLESVYTGQWDIRQIINDTTYAKVKSH